MNPIKFIIIIIKRNTRLRRMMIQARLIIKSNIVWENFRIAIKIWKVILSNSSRLVKPF